MNFLYNNIVYFLNRSRNRLISCNLLYRNILFYLFLYFNENKINWQVPYFAGSLLFP